MEPKEPVCPHELLWASKLPGPLSAMGAHGVFLVVGELDYCGPFGYCSWAHIFFLGRYISQSAWWNKNSENTIYFEDYFWYTRWGSQLQPTTWRAARRLRLGWGPAPWRVKQLCQLWDPSEKDSVKCPLGFFYPLLQKCGHFWQLDRFLTPEALYGMVHWLIQKTFPAVARVPHYAGTKSIISWSQKTGETDTLLPLTSTWVLELCGMRQGVSSSSFFDRQGRGVNGSFREDKIKLNSISLTLYLSFCVIF